MDPDETNMSTAADVDFPLKIISNVLTSKHRIATAKSSLTSAGSVCPPAGFMTPEERKVFENIRSPHLKYWIPVVWFSNLASKARQEGRIQDSIDLQNILNVTYEITGSFMCSVSEYESLQWKVVSQQSVIAERLTSSWKLAADISSAMEL